MQLPLVRTLSVASLVAVCGGALVAQSAHWVDRQVVPPCGATLVYDVFRSQTVSIGGAFCQMIGSWAGATWSTWTPTPMPPLNSGDSTYDSIRHVVVTVVGNQSTGLQTWEWDGTTWSFRGPGPTPPRGSFRLVFDAARAQTLLFGGNQGGDPGFADLWAWDGSSWTLRYIGGPSPRWNVAMTYDEQRQTVVLFGGHGEWQGQQAQALGDTWEWNGSYWFLHFGIPSPQNRSSAGFAYDSLRNRAVLVGGSGPAGQQQDTWEWDGTSWTQVAIPGPTTGSSSLAYDRARGVMVASRGSTWEYVVGPDTPATFTTYGTGCAGPAGVPSLDHVPGSLPHLGSVLQLSLQNLPTSPFNIPIGFFGFDASSWGGLPIPVQLGPLGFTGCSAWLAPLSATVLMNNTGTAAWDLPIPVNALALGTDIYFQGAVLAGGWNPGGFVFTNGGHAVVGSPQ